MKLVIRVWTEEAFEAALEVGVGAVSCLWPTAGKEFGLTLLKRWRAAAARRGVEFYLDWPELLDEDKFSQGLHHLTEAAALEPDLVSLADPGLMLAARRHYPTLRVQAGVGWGCHNSLSFGLAEELGLGSVVPAAAVTLKDLALMRRAAPLPLHVLVSSGLSGQRWFSLFASPSEINGSVACGWGAEETSDAWLAALEKLPGLAALGIEAAIMSRVFCRASTVSRLVPLGLEILSTPADRQEQALTAAKEILAAWGNSGGEEGVGKTLFSANLSRGGGRPERKMWTAPGLVSKRPGHSYLWLEGRGYEELHMLTKKWPDQLVVQLTPPVYRAILPELGRWRRQRRLVFRLPLVMSEESLPFYRKAVATLTEGGFRRFVAGNWGAVSLAREFGAEIFGDETLGVRNLAALEAALTLGVKKMCLPPGGEHHAWHRLLTQTSAKVWWSYLWHVPTLAVYSVQVKKFAASFPLKSDSRKLRWVSDGNLVRLCPKAPVDLRARQEWLERERVSPLMVSLPFSGLPWGETMPPVVKKDKTAAQDRPRQKLPS